MIPWMIPLLLISSGLTALMLLSTPTVALLSLRPSLHLLVLLLVTQIQPPVRPTRTASTLLLLFVKQAQLFFRLGVNVTGE
jgi:hypothetical protein